MDVFILTCEQCNGEYGEQTYCSAHSTLDKAKEQHSKVVNPKHLEIASTPEEPDRPIPEYYNTWKDAEYEPDAIKFQTGNWGFVVWQIKKLSVDSCVNSAKHRHSYRDEDNEDDA